MGKELVVLCDGTQNSPETTHTNVYLLRLALQKVQNGIVRVRKYYDDEQGWEVDETADNSSPSRTIKRLVYYDQGLGAPPPESSHVLIHQNNALLRWMEELKGALEVTKEKVKDFEAATMAVGITNNLKQAYQFLAEHYEPQDKIFLFGFSRGAYTIRLLISYLSYIGLIDKERLNDRQLIHAINEGCALYNAEVHPDSNQAVQQFRHSNCHTTPTKLIHFLGLWDTVRGPVIESVREDRKLSSIVDIARHALAIDEKRVLFKPELWIKSEGTDSAQVWFSGVHSDVGGGYKIGGRCLANISLRWMVQEAIKSGLSLTEPMIEQTIASTKETDETLTVLGMQHDSLFDIVAHVGVGSIRWNSTSTYCRPIAQLLVDEQIHPSVLTRYGQSVGVICGEDTKGTIVERKYQPAYLTHTLVAFKAFINSQDILDFSNKVDNLQIPEPSELSDYSLETSIVPPPSADSVQGGNS